MQSGITTYEQDGPGSHFQKGRLSASQLQALQCQQRAAIASHQLETHAGAAGHELSRKALSLAAYLSLILWVELVA